MEQREAIAQLETTATALRVRQLVISILASAVLSQDIADNYDKTL
jgi:hypothetical protein